MATVLVTGANRGIGLAFARAFAARGDRVIGTARRAADVTELQQVADEVLPLDVTDDDSVSALTLAIGETPIDLLVHNAGILVRDDLDDLDPAVFMQQVEVNALGPLRVTRALRPHLARAAAPRIVCITSRMGSITDNTSGRMYGYRASKAALNAVVKSLSIDLPWPVYAVHPGWVATRMTDHEGPLTPDQSVANMLALLDRLGPEHTGRFFHCEGHELPW